MRVIFAGTPEFAAVALEALAGAGHDIPLVLTQPDRPAGRGLKLTESATGQTARRLGLTTAKPQTLKEPAVQQQLRDLAPDVMVVAAYGLLLPQAVLDIPRRGCLNIHGSLLPRWRGAAPVQRALLAGDPETGVGIMQMEAGLDTGPVLLEKRLPILAEDTAATLFAKLTALGAEAIVEALQRLDQLSPRPQGDEGITYAQKLTRQEAVLDWSRPAGALARQIRAFDPFPGSETRHRGEVLKIWKSRVEPCPAGARRIVPGAVLSAEGEAPLVACGQDALRLLTVQQPGGRRVPAEEWARKAGLGPGDCFGTQAPPAEGA